MNKGLFIDTANLYFCVKKCFTGKKIDYKKLIQKLGPFDYLHAYGIRVHSEAKGFIKSLQDLNFTTRFVKVTSNKYTNLNVDIVIDTIRRITKLESVFIGSSDRDLLPFIQWLKEQGIKVTIVGCGIPLDLLYTKVNVIEISEDYLENATQTKNSINQTTETTSAPGL